MWDIIIKAMGHVVGKSSIHRDTMGYHQKKSVFSGVSCSLTCCTASTFCPQIPGAVVFFPRAVGQTTPSVHSELTQHCAVFALLIGFNVFLQVYKCRDYMIYVCIYVYR